jgi:hypothetical protein
MLHESNRLALLNWVPFGKRNRAGQMSCSGSGAVVKETIEDYLILAR